MFLASFCALLPALRSCIQFLLLLGPLVCRRPEAWDALGCALFAAPFSGASRVVWSLLVGLFFASRIALAEFLIDCIVVVIWRVL